MEQPLRSSQLSAYKESISSSLLGTSWHISTGNRCAPWPIRDTTHVDLRVLPEDRGVDRILKTRANLTSYIGGRFGLDAAVSSALKLGGQFEAWCDERLNANHIVAVRGVAVLRYHSCLAVGSHCLTPLALESFEKLVDSEHDEYSLSRFLSLVGTHVFTEEFLGGQVTSAWSASTLESQANNERSLSAQASGWLSRLVQADFKGDKSVAVSKASSEYSSVYQLLGGSSGDVPVELWGHAHYIKWSAAIQQDKLLYPLEARARRITDFLPSQSANQKCCIQKLNAMIDIAESPHPPGAITNLVSIQFRYSKKTAASCGGWKLDNLLAFHGYEILSMSGAPQQPGSTLPWSDYSADVNLGAGYNTPFIFFGISRDNELPITNIVASQQARDQCVKLLEWKSEKLLVERSASFGSSRFYLHLRRGQADGRPVIALYLIRGAQHVPEGCTVVLDESGAPADLAPSGRKPLKLYMKRA